MWHILAGIFLLFGMIAPAQAREPGIFQSKYESEGVAEAFVAGKQWFPYPEYEDREGWAAIFGPIAPEMVAKGEELLEYEWKYIPASAYLAYERTGDRLAMENREQANREALISLILAELAEGEGRFMDQIADGVWLASQSYSWVFSAHQGVQVSGRALPDSREHLIDLAAARFGAAVSIAYYFFHEKFDEMDPSISYAVEQAVKRNILDPFLEIETYHSQGWFGFGWGDKIPSLSNWTTWCNADSILAFLLMEKDQSRLDAALDRTVRSLDLFLLSVQQDGACEEGAGYWSSAAGKMYEWMQMLYDASDGAFDLFDNERIRRMGEFISRSYIGGGYTVNFADAGALSGTSSELVWNYGKAVGSKEMKDFALCLLGDRADGRFVYPVPENGDCYRAMQSLRASPAMREAVDSLNNAVAGSAAGTDDTAEAYDEVLQGLRSEVPAVTWYEETEVCYMRNSSRWFLGAKGGYNNESHNHNDIGTCVLYIKDIPVLVDAGIVTYTKQTFSADRYSIWTMQSEWHNLPMIDGVPQAFGQKYQAKNAVCTPSKGIFSVDIAGAYPEEAKCGEWVRTYRLALKGEPSLTITDEYALSSRSGDESEVTGRSGADVEHFLVKGQVVLPGESYGGKELRPGELLIICDNGLEVKMTYPKHLEATVDERTLDDVRLSKVWGPTLRRINLTAPADAPLRGSYEIKITAQAE